MNHTIRRYLSLVIGLLLISSISACNYSKVDVDANHHSQHDTSSNSESEVEKQIDDEVLVLDMMSVPHHTIYKGATALLATPSTIRVSTNPQDPPPNLI